MTKDEAPAFLKAWRKRLGLRQNKACILLDMSSTHYNRWELGDVKPAHPTHLQARCREIEAELMEQAEAEKLAAERLARIRETASQIVRETLEREGLEAEAD